MSSTCRTTVDSTVSGLSDDQLLEQTDKLARLDHQTQVVLIDHLCEIDARQLYLRRGYSSPFDYVTSGLGYSAGAAWRRINAMKLCRRIDEVRERLRDGSLTLDAAAQLQAAFERRERKRERERAREARDSAASPKRGPSGMALAGPARPPAPKPALDLSAQKALVQEAVGKSTRQVMQMLAGVDPALVAPADRVRPLGEDRWELKAVIDEECQRGLEQLKGLLSHVDPHMTFGQLVGRLVREGLDRHDPGRPRRGRRTSGRPAGAGQPSAPKRSVPPAEITGSPKKAQRDGDHEGTSSMNGSARPGRVATAAPKSQRRDMEAGAFGPKRPTRSARVATSAPKSKRDLGRQGPSAATRPARPAGATTSAPKSRATGRAIPAAVKRRVWQRDGGRCGYVDPRTGRRCASRHLLQVDHVFPYSLGGGPELGSLRLLSTAHHRQRHAGRAPSREPPSDVADALTGVVHPENGSLAVEAS